MGDLAAVAADGPVDRSDQDFGAVVGSKLRVAEWFEPGGPRTVDEVADTYSEFALKLLS